MSICYPLTRLEIIGFVYPFFVYDGNRPLTPVLRQRRCSLMYDVYWLTWWLLLWGSKYLEYIPESELNILQSEQWNEQWKQSTEYKLNYELSNNWIKITGNRQLLTNTNKSRESFKRGWNVTVQHLHKIKYPCDYGVDNYNPICPGIKGVTSDVQRRAFLLLS